MSLRIKGQEALLAFSSPDGVVLSLKKITNFELTTLGEILEENYVGDPAPEFDDIANGVEVKFECHFNDSEVFEFFQKVEDRRRRVGDAAGVFSAVAVFKFPTGKTRKGIVPNLFFGDLPVKFGSRKAYGATSITAKASKVTWV